MKNETAILLARHAADTAHLSTIRLFRFTGVAKVAVTGCHLADRDSFLKDLRAGLKAAGLTVVQEARYLRDAFAFLVDGDCDVAGAVGSVLASLTAGTGVIVTHNDSVTFASTRGDDTKPK